MRPYLLVVAPYYTEISDLLVAGATAAVKAAGGKVETLVVPGALEIPVAVAMAHETGGYTGFIALGCVLRGETSHYDTVANESARGLQEIALRELAAIGNGILTCETMAQAVVRADPAQGDKGGDAARAAIRLVEIQRMFGME